MHIVSISSTIHNSNGNAREIISQKSSRALCIIYVLERVSTPEEKDADADTDRGSWPLAHLLQQIQKYFINTEYYKCNNFITCLMVSILYCARNIYDVYAITGIFCRIGSLKCNIWSLRMPHTHFLQLCFVDFVRKEWLLGYCAIVDVSLGPCKDIKDGRTLTLPCLFL